MNLIVFVRIVHMKIHLSENLSPCYRQESYCFFKLENGMRKLVQEQLIPEKNTSVGTLARSVFP